MTVEDVLLNLPENERVVLIQMLHDEELESTQFNPYHWIRDYFLMIGGRMRYDSN